MSETHTEPTDDRPIKRVQLTPLSGHNYIFIIERTQHAAFRLRYVHCALCLPVVSFQSEILICWS